MSRPVGASGERLIAFVLYPGLTVLDLVGPLQVLTALQRLVPRLPHRRRGGGPRARADRHRRAGRPRIATFDEVPHPAILLVPGGALPTIRAMSDPGVRDYVRTAAASAELVTSVCTGSLILGRRRPAGGPGRDDQLVLLRDPAEPGRDVPPAAMGRDGNLIMSAGVSAGVDMALHLAARLTDEATARKVQLAVDYDPHPPYGGIDYANIPRVPRAMRGAISLVAPAIAVRSRKLLRQERAAGALA